MMRTNGPTISGMAVNGVLRWLPFLGLVAAVAAAPLGAQQVDLPEGVTSELIFEGKTLFLDQGLCFICHGTDATGARGVGADLTDEEWWHSDGSYEAIVNQILTGVSSEEARNPMGAMMPPRGGSEITDEQVRAVAAYVWSLRLVVGEAPRREAQPGG
jgi:mono/diheme cytochrome c family protein